MVYEASARDNLHEKCLVLETENSKLKAEFSTFKVNAESKISELEALVKWYEERLRLNAHKNYYIVMTNV